MCVSVSSHLLQKRRHRHRQAARLTFSNLLRGRSLEGKVVSPEYSLQKIGGKPSNSGAEWQYNPDIVHLCGDGLARRSCECCGVGADPTADVGR
eukprot:6214352-Pleurochrysis_carterae.AAC.1